MRCLVHCNRAGVKIQSLVNKLVTRAKKNRTRNTQIERVDVLCSLCILRVLRGFSSTHSAKFTSPCFGVAKTSLSFQKGEGRRAATG
jgi:hypothetical protein